MYFVYLIQCEDGTLYTGITTDIEKRFLVHSRGKGAKYTRSHKPVKIVHTEQFPTKSEAASREAEIKSWTRAEKLHLIGHEGA